MCVRSVTHTHTHCGVQRPHGSSASRPPHAAVSQLPTSPLDTHTHTHTPAAALCCRRRAPARATASRLRWAGRPCCSPSGRSLAAAAASRLGRGRRTVHTRTGVCVCVAVVCVGRRVPGRSGAGVCSRSADVTRPLGAHVVTHVAHVTHATHVTHVTHAHTMAGGTCRSWQSVRSHVRLRAATCGALRATRSTCGPCCR
jgi:hypothetical protein